MKIRDLRRGVVRLAAVTICLSTPQLVPRTSAQTLPPGWSVLNVGNPAIVGSATYTSGTFSIRGAGIDIWNTSDQFAFVNRPVSGDVTIVARIATLQKVNTWSKAGVMIRQSLTAGSKHAFVMATPGNGIRFQRRVTTGGTSDRMNGGSGTAPVWLKLERRSNTFTAYRSTNGTTWTTIGSAAVSMGSTVYVGMAVTSHDPATIATATFSNVTVTVNAVNRPPAVSLTAPTDGATYTAPANIPLAATASDPDGTIARVDFYAGASFLGTDTSSPYAYTWSGAPVGQYAITAVARDQSGAATASGARNVTVSAEGSNQAPLVSLTAPAAGATYTAPASIAIAASGSDADGVLKKVEFYAGSTLIGSDATAPYTMSWSSVPAGQYALMAVAQDNAGGMTVSGARDIRVDDPRLPRTLTFVPSPNHATAVDRYFLEIFPLGADVTAANPVATRDLGKPAIVSGECRVDVSQTTVGLAPGTYIATVTAIGTGGSAQSAASSSFVR